MRAVEENVVDVDVQTVGEKKKRLEQNRQCDSMKRLGRCVSHEGVCL